MLHFIFCLQNILYFLYFSNKNIYFVYSLYNYLKIYLYPTLEKAMRNIKK